MVLSVNRSGGGGMLERGPLRQKPVEDEENGKEEPPKAETTARTDIPMAGQPEKKEPSGRASS